MTNCSKTDVGRIYWRFLTIFVVIGAALGVILGLILKSLNATDATFVDIIKTPGDLFTRALKSLLVPYILCSMITSVFQLRSVANGSKIGWAACGYYVSTTLVAAVLACFVSFLVIVPRVTVFDDHSTALPEAVNAGAAKKLGAFASYQESCSHMNEVWCKLRGTLDNMVPSSIVGAMAESQLLGVLTFSAAVGLLIARKQDGTPPRIIEFAEEVQAVITKLMFVVIAITPVAVCSLLCWIILKQDLSKLAIYIGWLLCASILSQAIHALVLYPTIYLFFYQAKSYHLCLERRPCNSCRLCNVILGGHTSLDPSVRHRE
jgi:Na+/H+-dicarboxylate symporter